MGHIINRIKQDMKDYSKGKIYTIRCITNDTLIYVGSTIQPLCERLAQHKRCSKYETIKDRLLYTTINEDWDNWKIELNQLYPCSCSEELKAKEGEIIRLISTLNKNIAGRKQKEWRKDNKEKVVEYKKNEYLKHKDKYLERGKSYNETHKEDKAEYDKKYREKYREEILQKKKIAYQKKKLN